MNHQTRFKRLAIHRSQQRPLRYGVAYSKYGSLLVLVICLLWPAALAQADSPTLDQNKPLIYTVQTGDTLIFIALKYNLNLADIALANHLRNPGLILPGQQLILPGASSLSNPESAERIGEQLHTVQAGETIGSIANSYYATPADVIALNRLDNPDLLQVGQILKVPVIQPPFLSRWSGPLPASPCRNRPLSKAERLWLAFRWPGRLRLWVILKDSRSSFTTAAAPIIGASSPSTL